MHVTALIALMGLPRAGHAHFFVGEIERLSATPSVPGHGWLGEAYLDLPDAATNSLLGAEVHVLVNNVEPDFTFRTTYIDFPAGPEEGAFDSDLVTIGDFLDDYISDVSDPAKLDTPMGHFLLVFTGYIDVRAQLNTQPTPGLPILFDFGLIGYGGYTLRMGGSTIIRVQNFDFNNDNPFTTENALVHGMGIFPVTVKYLNRYKSDVTAVHGRAGLELYGFHPGGLPWPGGERFSVPQFGNLTVTPPSVVYQVDEVPPLPKGDDDGDGSITLADFAVMQACYTGDGMGSVDESCAAMDFDGDGSVGTFDLQRFELLLKGPKVYQVSPCDFDANGRIDLNDYRWFQWCLDTGGSGGEDRLALPSGCNTFDMNHDGFVNANDYPTFQKLLNGDGAAP